MRRRRDVAAACCRVGRLRGGVLLGHGGMGEAYRGRETSLPPVVAVTVPERFALDPGVPRTRLRDVGGDTVAFVRRRAAADGGCCSPSCRCAAALSIPEDHHLIQLSDRTHLGGRLRRHESAQRR